MTRTGSRPRIAGKWGLIPDMTGSVTLRELVPMDIAKRLTTARAANLAREVPSYVNRRIR